jgi:hypothetical protein
MNQPNVDIFEMIDRIDGDWRNAVLNNHLILKAGCAGNSILEPMKGRYQITAHLIFLRKLTVVVFCGFVFGTPGPRSDFLRHSGGRHQGPGFGRCCKRDLEVMHRQFVQMSSAIQYQLNEQVIAQDDFGQKRLNNILRTIKPQPDDILFLYYTGHGYNLNNRADRFPILMLEKDDAMARQNPGLLSVHKPSNIWAYVYALR